MRFIKYISIAIFLCICATSQAQTFGVRAGLNNGKFIGPSENEGESYGFNGGFHFGINYGYNVTDIFSVVFEIGYAQYGSNYTYNGDSYFIIRDSDLTVYEKGTRDMELSISNGYLSFPVVANYKLSNKWEIFGGAYASMLVSPTARGRVRFVSTENPEDIVFTQSLDYNYSSDEAREGIAVNGLRDIGVYVEGDEVYFPKIAGAYYQFGEKNGNLMNKFDAGLIAGFNYFLNKGFYAGLRLEYGLTDQTNEDMDASISTLDENNLLILRDDNDTHLGVNISIGFRF